MIYLSAKKDLEYISNFYFKTMEYLDIKQVVEGYNRFEMGPVIKDDLDDELLNNYLTLREELNKMRSHAKFVGGQYNADFIYISDYPPAIGLSSPISVHPFDAIINDPGHKKITDLEIKDAIQYLIGKIEAKMLTDKKALLNPLFWLKSLLELILQLPFYILELAGFNREKIEDHLLSKVFKLIYFIAIIYISIKFGLDINEYINLIKL